MKVRLTTSRASLRAFQAEGSIIDLPHGEATRMIAAGQAVPVREDEREMATVAAPETASRRGRGGRRAGR